MAQAPHAASRKGQRARAKAGSAAAEAVAPGKVPVHRASVTICGDEYVIRGATSPEYIAHLAGRVDAAMQGLLRADPHLTRDRAAILAAIHLADEAEHLRRENEELTRLLQEARPAEGRR